jgi:flagellar biosynthesis chaperone FliJ
MGFQISPEDKKTEKKKEQDVGFFESALAGVATGLWNIPKGFVSLGAELYDLAADTNTAKDVEQWFDDVNPFDDEAEARTIGKITQAITQIAPLAIKGAQLGTQAALIAKRALDAKKAGKYLSLAKVGSKIMGPTTGAIVGSGVGEAIVADEDIGTFADIARGTSLEPFAITMMDKETKEGRSEAFRRLKNRLKFGTEGALFNLALVGAGKGIQQLRKPVETGLLEYAESPLKRRLQKYGLFGLKPEGTGTKYTFEARRFGLDNIKAAEFAASKSVQELDTSIKELGDVVKTQYYTAPKGLKESVSSQEKFLTDLYDVLRPMDNGSESLLTATRREGGKDIIKSQIDDVIAFKNINDGIKEVTDQTIKLGDDRAKNLIPEAQFTEQSQALLKQSNTLTKQLDDLTKKRPNIEQLVKKTEKGFFKQKDYSNTKQFNELLDKVRRAGGNTEKLENAVKNFRLSVDNMSVRLLQRRMPGEIADGIKENLGKYLNSQYKQFEMSGPLEKYKPTGTNYYSN